MKFRFQAFDRAGASRNDVVEAASKAEAMEVLRRDGLFVSNVEQIGEASASQGSAPRKGFARRGKGGRLRLVAILMRHLSVLVSTGTPLVEALSALERQAPDAVWRAILSDIRGRLEDGSTFSDALAAHPRYFDAVCRSLVRAGESGGKLDVMLQRLAKLTRQQLKVRQTITGAMVYPCLLIVVAVSVLVVMMCFVMPRFSGLFQTLDAPLPPTTKLLMSISGFVRGWWWALVVGFGGAFGGLATWLRTESGKRAFDSFILRVPQLSRLSRALVTARIARLMGLLLESRVPMLECLALTRESLTNHHYANLMERTQESLTRGESFSSGLGGGGLISPSVVEAVRNAERTGQVGPVLSSMADFLDEENEVIVKSVTSLVEPLILITLGLVVGFVAISMFLPLFDLTSTAGGGGPQ